MVEGTKVETPGHSHRACRNGTQEVSRRDFFGVIRKDMSPVASLPSAAAIAASACGVAGLTAMLTMTSQTAQAGPRSVSGDVDKSALLAKLVRRLTWGFTQEEYTLAQQLGYDGYLEYHLNPAAIDDSVLNARLTAYPTLNMQSHEVFPLPGNLVVNELSEAMILRAVYSKRQLYERMVDFWTDHFNTDIAVDLCFYLKTPDDRDVIRANALGNFPAMLRASAQSPCMLKYLGNDTNVAGLPNENYARELMELHTLSAAGPFTQNDVEEVARCFTAWRINRSTAGNGWGHFFFEGVYHDNAPKTVLGQQIPANGGMQDGFRVLDILSTHPFTANFIATKLCRRFLGEDVPASVIAPVAATYTATGGDIKAMMRVVLKPENVYTDFGPRHKRPQHFMVSALRVLPTPITSTQILRITHLSGSGHLPFNWGPPDGYPDKLSHWQGGMLDRWNFAALLVTNGIPGIIFDVTTYFAGLSTAQQMIDRIDNTLFGNELPAGQKSQLLTYLSVNPADVARRRDVVGLALSTPSFQWY